MNVDLPRDLDERAFQLAALQAQFVNYECDDLVWAGNAAMIVSGGDVVGAVDDLKLLYESVASA